MRRLGGTNHYERLGVRREATPAELRQAYRRKALDAHPDRLSDGAPADVMAAINEAWNALRDPKRRAQYDRLLADALPQSAPATSPPPRHAAGVRDSEEVDEEPAWVDLTPGIRTFRWMLTIAIVLGSLFMLLVFALIIWPETS